MKSANNKIYSFALLVFVSLLFLSLISQKSTSRKSEDKINSSLSAHSPKAHTQPLQPQSTSRWVKLPNKMTPGITRNQEYRAYLALQSVGVIGVQGNNTSDNPADNIFTVSLDRDLSSDDKVILCYTLTGVEDKSNVTYSINDYPAMGGYLIKKTDAASLQKVEINPRWLKRGFNRIQFSVPEGAAYGYKIENLSLEVSSRNESLCVVNTGNTTYDNQAYIQGFILNKNTQILLDGKEIEVKDGIFESVVTDIKNNTVTLTAVSEGKTHTEHILFNMIIRKVSYCKF
ncbi:MAG: hypothetical protein QM751_13620 [Paludibacteraceae bacterium]